MPVVAVVNRKGGSGKSTLATHLAAYLSTNGMSVMLGDVDKQASTQSWLKRRELVDLPDHPPIVGWTVDPKNVVRPPAGIAHVVLDTPGGLRGFDLARVVMYADAIVMPICNSLFDRESASECVAELMTLPRVASGRCRIAAIGMRLDARTKAGDVLKEWARANQVSFIGVLRETQTYVRCIEQGLTLFDMPPAKFEADLAQWRPILRWLGGLVQPVPVAQNTKTGPVTRLEPVTRLGPATEMPPMAAHVRPVVRPLGEPTRVNVPAEPMIPAYLQVNGTPAVTAAPITAAPATQGVAMDPTLARPGDRLRPATLVASAAVPEPARPATLVAPAVPEPARPATLMTNPADAVRPATLVTRPIDAVRPATLVSNAAKAPVSSASPSRVERPHPAVQRVQPRPAITAARPKTIAQRLGNLIDSIPIPRFLQRDS